MFFIGNYLTHAATVKLPPATPILANIWICFSALLMPATGLVFGLMAFSQAIKGRGKSELENAALARALCMYVRTADWQSRPRSLKIESRVTESPRPPKAGESLLIRCFIAAYRLSKSWKSSYWSALAILLVHVAAALDQSCLFRMMIDVDHEKQRHKPEDQQSNNPDIEMSIRCVYAKHNPTELFPDSVIDQPLFQRMRTLTKLKPLFLRQIKLQIEVIELRSSRQVQTYMAGTSAVQATHWPMCR